MAAIDELKEKFSNLTEEEKLVFIKSIMPSFCEAFRKNRQNVMLLCEDMMKWCGMDMQSMMRTMMGMMNPGRR